MRSSDEARRMLRDHGLSVVDWAHERGFAVALVYAVLSGRRKCLRGESHRIAVALGLKVAGSSLDSPKGSR